MKKNLLFSLFAILVVCFSSAQNRTRSYAVDGALAPRERTVDFLHLKLEISFDAPKGKVFGVVSHRFKTIRPFIDSLFLDAPGILIKEVLHNNNKLQYKTNTEGVIIFFKQPLKWGVTDSIRIVYEATPRKGLYFIGWNDKNNISRKQIWSQGQGIDNRYWIPMYDEMNDKITTELHVTVSNELQVLSNGNKIAERKNTNLTKTWVYKMDKPHAPYLIMIGVGNYKVKQIKSKSGVPINLYYYPDWENRVDATYKQSAQMIDFFEKETGVKYPWSQYSMIPVQDFMYGAMENTTATLYGDFFMVDERGFLDRNFIGVNAHELAHQWFGDCITARSDAHHWLQESFATYYNMMFEREFFGIDYFDWARRKAQEEAIEESAKNKFPVAHSEAGSVRHYPQGAFVLNMLKYVAGGNEPFNKVIKHYLEKHKYQNVDTEDLLTAFHDELGLSLDWFFEQWIYKSGQPKYKISYSLYDNKCTLDVEQVQEQNFLLGLPESGNNIVNSVSADEFVPQKTNTYKPPGLFKMPVWIEVVYADKTSEKKLVWIENQNQRIVFAVPDNKKVAYVLFDPNNEVLKEVEFEKPFEMLKLQALNAEYMLDRLDAVRAMEKVSFDQKRELFFQVFANEKFYAIKEQILLQLKNDTNEKTGKLFRDAINSNDPMVRKAALKNASKIDDLMLIEIEKHLSDSSYEVIATVLDILYQVKPGNMSAYISKVNSIEGVSGKNVLIKKLEYDYTTTGNKTAAEQLVSFCGNSYEFRTRINAMDAIRRMNYFSLELVNNLCNAVYSPNGRLSRPAGSLLAHLYSINHNKKVIDEYIDSQKWEDWQLKAVRYYCKQ